MLAAFTAWNGRIAPLFDVAQQLWVVEAQAGLVMGQRMEMLEGALPLDKVSCLTRLGIGTLVCGAITLTQQMTLAAKGIQVVPFVAGDLAEVVSAWLQGELTRRSAFAMPGCCGRWRGGAPHAGKGDFVMPGQEQGRGGGRGGGMGRGQGGGGGIGRRGRKGGPLAAGPQGRCVCSQCGHSEPHEVGVPCASKQCPTCGIPLTRR